MISAEIDAVYSKGDDESTDLADWAVPMTDFLKDNQNLLRCMVSGFLQNELKCYLHLMGDGQFEPLVQLGRFAPGLFAQNFRIAYLNFIFDTEIVDEDKSASLEWLQENHPEILRDCQSESAERDAHSKRSLKPGEAERILKALLKPGDNGSKSQ